MGAVLGWARIVGSPASTDGTGPEPGSTLNFDRIYDEISVQLYWNVKMEYEEAKRAFFDYVRRKNIDQSKEKARAALDHAANLQQFGVDHEADDEIEAAREEVQRACENAWRLYQTSSSKDSIGMKLLLINALADAQFVGLESTTTENIAGALADVIEHPARSHQSFADTHPCPRVRQHRWPDNGMEKHQPWISARCSSAE